MKSQFSLKSWLVGCSMLAMTTTGAFAEVVYNRGNSADPESLDPHKTSTVYEANILRDLFMGLMVQDAKAQVQPGAAESHTVSADGKTYTFKLRQGALWSDGSPVTAGDVSRALRLSEAHAEDELMSLVGLRLVAADGAVYSYAPTAKVRATVDALADLYPMYRIAVAQAIFSGLIRPRIRDRADR